MTPPCVVPTFRPYTVENLEFGGFYASSCESRVRPGFDQIGPVIARSALRDGCGRDAHYCVPPAQNRTCGFPAYGSHLG